MALFGLSCNGGGSVAQTDTVAPAAIQHLRVDSVGTGIVALSWTAPGDDGESGTAAAYDLRMGFTALTEATFPHDGMHVLGPPPPAPAGTRQAFIAVSPGLHCHAAMRATDDAG